MRNFFFFYVIICSHHVQDFAMGQQEYRIGAIFDRNSADEIKNVLHSEIKLFAEKDSETVRLVLENRTLDATDSFAVSNAICYLLKKGVFGIIGVAHASALSTIQSYSNTFKVPFLVLSMAQNTSNHKEFQLFMRPMYINGLLDVIIDPKYNWEHILYMYDTDEGLIRLQQLFQAVNQREVKLDIEVKRVSDTYNAYEILKAIHEKEPKKDMHVLLDMPTKRAEQVMLRVKEDKDILQYRFHFLLGDLGMDEMNFTNFKRGVNVTGFKLVNQSSMQMAAFLEYFKAQDPYNRQRIQFESALMYDAVRLFRRAIKKLHGRGGGRDHVGQPIRCMDSENSVIHHRGMAELMEILKSTEVQHEDLTGMVAFDKDGFRKNFVLQLMEITVNMGLATVGKWTRESGLVTHDPKREQSRQSETKSILKVTTILESPYIMFKDKAMEKRYKESDEQICGNENFIGFCADLAREVAKIVKFNYSICLVKDRKYGEKLDDETWNGMVGELVREEVDMAIAPMSISSQRERVVDFTKPYMSLGISIMIRKTPQKTASVFSFMDPLSYEIWMCILFAYIGVSVVLFLVSRFSPSEWHVDDGASITNDFTISNSLWYSLGAFMQQGCDISPRSVSGRIVGSVWWFFTLIIISSYTANLAAFLTVERMLTPIESAEDLAKQTEIQYGTLNSGSTKNFFKQSKVAVYERMWAYMQSATPSVFVDGNKEGIDRVRKGNYAFLIESTTNDYINMQTPCNTMKVGTNLDSKGYGIATPSSSDLRDQLTLAVLRLRENGELEEMRKEWWDRKSKCPLESGSQEGGQTELNLTNVAGIFFILVGGLIISVIIACFEFIYKSKIDSTRSKASFTSVLRCKARLSFRGSLDRDTPAASTTPLRKSMSTYTYTGPTQMVGTDGGFADTNTHTQV